jgi:signal peptide peptidase SppA
LDTKCALRRAIGWVVVMRLLHFETHPMSNLLIRIADRVMNRPLMILPEKLALIASVLEGRIGIDATELNEIEAEHLKNGSDASRFVGNFELADPRDPKSVKPYRTQKGVAVIPVMGSLVNRGAWIGSRSGMTSYEGLKHQISVAAQDASVSSILLDMDSPGGEAVGAFEVADVVREAGKSTPVVAIVNGMSASAAYAIASAASQIITMPSGVSGSVGVVLMHADYSHALHERGVKPTLIHAGARKVDGNPYQPLTDDVKAELKAEVDQFYDLFVSSVAKGRKGRMTEKAVRGTEARTFIGQAAVDVGLADAVGSFESVLADLSKRGRRVSTPAPPFRTSGSGLQLTSSPPSPQATIMPQANLAISPHQGPPASSYLAKLDDGALAEAIASLRRENVDPTAVANGWDEAIAKASGKKPHSIEPSYGWMDVIAKINKEAPR